MKDGNFQKRKYSIEVKLEAQRLRDKLMKGRLEGDEKEK